MDFEMTEDSVKSASDKKRLLSLKRKKQSYKAQEQTIRNALNSVDSGKSSNKIVFSDDVDYESVDRKFDKNSKKKKALFENDDEDKEEVQWDESELDAKANIKKKMLKLKFNASNDERFVLDERFIDDDEDEHKTKQETVDSSTVDEKKWQLDILGNVLGKSIVAASNESHDVTRKNTRMLRYDPTASENKDYEISVEKSEQGKPRKKRKKCNITEPEEEIPIPTSSEVFYNVSESLKDSLKQNEGFSLLQAFGRSTDDVIDENETISKIEETKAGFQFDMAVKNPFQYDSSDDDKSNKNARNRITSSHQVDDTLFFRHSDSRFQKAKQFFKTQAADEDNSFKFKRRELKELVRSKIRNNLKKTAPWNRKKVRKITRK